MLPYGGPAWLRGRTDDKYFKDLYFVYLNKDATDEDLEWLPRLGGYQGLHLTGSRVTDRGLAKLNASAPLSTAENRSALIRSMPRIEHFEKLDPVNLARVKIMPSKL